MDRLGNLWIEMLQYEKLPEAPKQSQELIVWHGGLRNLVREGAGILSREKGWSVSVAEDLPDLADRDAYVRYWVLTAEEDAGRVFVSTDASQIVIPAVFGLEEDECLRFSEFEDYERSFLSGHHYICAGELLCHLFALISSADSSQKYIRLSGGTLPLADGAYMVWKTVRHPEPFFYFDNTYNGKLRELQQCQLACLEEFDRICKAHGITYFLGGGTLLGAIRHRNLIPWDDDIDVMMLRDQYEKFLSVVQKEISLDFYYQSNKTDPDYHSIFDKIRMNGTVFKTEFSRQFSGMHQGIFVDIFVHDRTAKHRSGQKLHVFFTLLARSLVFHKWEGTDMHFYGKMKRWCRIMTWYKNRTSMKKLERIQHKVVTHFSRKHTGYLYDGTGEHLRHGAFPEKWLSDVRIAFLGGKPYPVPVEAEKYLEYSYGKDYMQLPPPQKRKATHPVVELKMRSRNEIN